MVPKETVYPKNDLGLRDAMVVVARSWENLHWLDGLNRPFIIYNKGDEDVKHPYIRLPNVGRDIGTYLQYIVDNYNNLSDFTFFLQGDPFDKWPPLFHWLNSDHWLDSLHILCHSVYTEDIHGYPSGAMKGMIPLLKELGMYRGDYIHHVFGIGSQYLVPKRMILSKSHDWWKHTQKVFIGNGEHSFQREQAYRFEKILMSIFLHVSDENGIKLPSTEP